MHPSVLLHFYRIRSWRQKAKAECSRHPSHQQHSPASPMAFPGQIEYVILPAHSGSSHLQKKKEGREAIVSVASPDTLLPCPWKSQAGSESLWSPTPKVRAERILCGSQIGIAAKKKKKKKLFKDTVTSSGPKSGLKYICNFRFWMSTSVVHIAEHIWKRN